MVVSTLNELPLLKCSGFGQPWPRHGLDLLYWFAHDYIDLSNGEIVPWFRPQNGNFGFHKYHNRIEEEDHIVPIQNLPYYEVGNLNYPGAEQLPDYVAAKYNRSRPILDSNKDRIIVRLDENGSFNRVYVTEHSDLKRFDSSKTYRVSQDLLQIIQNMSRDQYLSVVTNTREEHVRLQSQSYETPSNNDSWCAIL
uniref:GCHV-induced protein 1 n=1 Tax=Ctenopharyngodon idella TaxID=7959 RepID=D5KZW6_CTEID|nr:GCHV-induced protein 1 [Ctenopharyngodon idella]